MNWRLIFALSLFGVVMAVAGLFGLTRGTEPLLWLVIFIIYAICIAQYAGGKYFLHGFLVSLLNGVWIAIIHFAFFPMFLRNNPDVAVAFQNFPMRIDLRFLNLIVGPIAGALFGIVAGLFAFVAAKLLRKSPAVV
jgi:hypothetical protein